MSDLFPDDRRSRRAAPPELNWQQDAGVPVGIVADAKRIGARGAFVRGDLIVVVLASGKPCWLNRAGQQVGRSLTGPVGLLDEVPWPLASVSERTRAA